MMQRNIRLYPWYTAFFEAHFWMPVFFLYFNSLFSVRHVLLLEAVYYAAVVILEVPSGYFSDAAGRKRTLAISAVALVIAHALFVFSSSFMGFAIAQIGLAAGIAFRSGTNTSFHYESLAALGREPEFDRREAIVSRNGFIGSAMGAVVGGLVGALSLRYAYGLALANSLVLIVIVLAFTEPGTKAGAEGGFIRNVLQSIGELRSPALAWLFGFAVLATMLNHVPYEFYQPYIALLSLDGGLTRESPSIAGFHMAITMVVAAAVASQSIRIRDRIGTGPTLLLSMAVQTITIVIMGLILHPLVLALVLLRSCPRALMVAPLNAAITPRVAHSHRATFLSLQSLAGRMSFSVLLIILAGVVGDTEAADWQALGSVLRICGGLALACLIVLALIFSRVRESVTVAADS